MLRCSSILLVAVLLVGLVDGMSTGIDMTDEELQQLRNKPTSKNDIVLTKRTLVNSKPILNQPPLPLLTPTPGAALAQQPSPPPAADSPLPLDSSQKASSPRPPDDVQVLVNALVDSLLSKKSALVTVVTWFLRTVISMINDLVWQLFGISLPPLHDILFPKENRHPQDSGPSSSEFVLPILGRPMSFDDVRMAQRIFMELVDTYQAWDKKVSGSQKTAP